MKYSDLVKLAAQKAKVSQTDAKRVIDSVSSVIVETVAGGDEVVIPSIGKIAPKKRPARKMRSLQPPHKVIEVPESTTAVLKVGKPFKDLMNK